MNCKYYWSQEEIQVLCASYIAVSHKSLLKLLPKRTIGGIRSKAYTLGIKKENISIQNLASSIKRLSEIDKGYVAGMIDGEGTIALHLRKNRDGKCIEPLVQIANTDVSLLECIKDKISNGNGVHVNNHALRLSGSANVYNLLLQIRDYLILKRSHADIVLDYLESHKFGEAMTNNDLILVNRIMKLNRRNKR